MSAQFNLIKFHPATPNPPRWWLQSPRGRRGGLPPTSKWVVVNSRRAQRGYRGSAHRGTPPEHLAREGIIIMISGTRD